MYPNKEEVPLNGIKVSSTKTKSRRMTWIKPEFDFVDLCCEVTLYHHR